MCQQSWKGQAPRRSPGPAPPRCPGSQPRCPARGRPAGHRGLRLGCWGCRGARWVPAGCRRYLCGAASGRAAASSGRSSGSSGAAGGILRRRRRGSALRTPALPRGRGRRNSLRPPSAPGAGQGRATLRPFFPSLFRRSRLPFPWGRCPGVPAVPRRSPHPHALGTRLSPSSGGTLRRVVPGVNERPVTACAAVRRDVKNSNATLTRLYFSSKVNFECCVWVAGRQS